MLHREASSLPSRIHILGSCFLSLKQKPWEWLTENQCHYKGLQRRSRTCIEMEGTRAWEGNLGFNSELYSFLNSADLNPITLNCHSDDSRRNLLVGSLSWFWGLWIHHQLLWLHFACLLLGWCKQAQLPTLLVPGFCIFNLTGALLVFMLKMSKAASTSKWCLSEFSLNKLFSFILLSLGISYIQKCLDICLTSEKPYLSISVGWQGHGNHFIV